MVLLREGYGIWTIWGSMAPPMILSSPERQLMTYSSSEAGCQSHSEQHRIFAGTSLVLPSSTQRQNFPCLHSLR